jgi:hypothetical protein
LFRWHLPWGQDRPAIAHLGADLAASAQERINPNFALSLIRLDDGRAPNPQAQSATATSIGVHFDGLPLRSSLWQQGTCPLYNHNRRPFGFQSSAQSSLHLTEIVGVHSVDMRDANRLGYFSEIHRKGRFAS